MKTTLTISLICLLTLGFNGYSIGQTTKQKIKIEKEVDSIFQTMVKEAENLNYDKLSTSVDDRYNAGFIVNGLYYEKYDLLINSIKANSSNLVKQSITIQNKKITVLSDKVVLLTASGDAYVQINNGQSFNSKFFWSFVYERINEDWKVIQSHQSNTR